MAAERYPEEAYHSILAELKKGGIVDLDQLVRRTVAERPAEAWKDFPVQDDFFCPRDRCFCPLPALPDADE